MSLPAKPNLGWKLFAALMAVVVLIGDVPKLGSSVMPLTVLRVVANCLAVTGVCAYAFRLRILPVWFWRIFAPGFLVFTTVQIARSVGPILTFVPAAKGSLAGALGLATVIGMMLVPVVFICLALLRHARIVGENRLPIGGRPAVSEQHELNL